MCQDLNNILCQQSAAVSYSMGTEMISVPINVIVCVQNILQVQWSRKMKFIGGGGSKH